MMQAEAIPRQDAPVSSPIEKAAKLKAALVQYDQDLHEIEVQIRQEYESRAEELRQAREETEQQYHRVIQTCRDSGCTENEKYIIRNKARRTRTVITTRFAEAFPELVLTIATIPVQKAEAMVGRVQLEPLCTVTEGPEDWQLEHKPFKKAVKGHE